jgi:pimeloyl-ACP methyl ester carboxylesterase
MSGTENGGRSGGRALPRGLSRALDTSRVGVFGHSGGGFTAAEAMLDDDRIDAGVNLDSSLIYSEEGREFGEVTERGLDRPFMLVGAGTSGNEDKPHTHENAPDWKAFWQNSTGWKLGLHIPEGEHFTFTDHQVIVPQLDEKLGLPDWLLTGSIGTVDPERIVTSQRAYVAAFFDRHVRREHRELLEGPSPDHPDVDLVR